MSLSIPRATRFDPTESMETTIGISSDLRTTLSRAARDAASEVERGVHVGLENQPPTLDTN